MKPLAVLLLAVLAICTAAITAAAAAGSQPTTNNNNRLFSASSSGVDALGRSYRLEAHGEHAAHAVHLDRHKLLIADIQCAEHAHKLDHRQQHIQHSQQQLSLLISMKDAAALAGLAQQLQPGALVSAGRGWRCVQHPRHEGRSAALHARVVASSVDAGDGDGSIKLLVQPVALASFLKQGSIRLAMDRLDASPDVRARHVAATGSAPSVIRVDEPVQPLAASQAAVQAVHAEGLFGFFGSLLSDAYHGVADLGHDVVSAAKTVYKVATGIATGSLDGSDGIGDSFGYNYDASTNSAASTLALGDHIKCTNCFLGAQVGVTVAVDISDYELVSASIIFSGSMTASVEADLTYDAAYNLAYNKTLTTLKLPDIDFDLMGLPFVLHTSVPVTVGWNLAAAASAQMGAYVNATGQVEFGIEYDGSTGGVNYVSNHTWRHAGALQPFSGNAQVGGQVYLQPMAVLDIDGLGGPSLAVKPFLEVLLDMTNANPCAPGSSSGGVAAFYASVNYGAQISLSAMLEVAVLDHVFWSHQFSPWTLLSVKEPAMSGCWELGDGLALPQPALRGAAAAGDDASGNSVQPGHFAPSAMAATTSSNTPTLMVGQVWAGWQVMYANPPAPCPPPSKLFNVYMTFQLLEPPSSAPSTDDDGSAGPPPLVLFGTGANIVTSDGARCTLQSRYQAQSVGGSEYQFSPTLDANGDEVGLFYSCSNSSEPIHEHSFPASFSSDFDMIYSGCDPSSSCGCIQLMRTNQP